MAPMHLRNILVAALTTVYLCACSSRTAGWDADSRTFSTPDEGLRLTLPGEDEWTVAAIENLPANILFCGVRPDIELCAMLFLPDVTDKQLSVRKYSNEAIDSVLGSLTRQTAPHVKAEQVGRYVEKCRYLQAEAIKFRIDLVITDESSSDKYSTSYMGYIFPGDTHMLGFTAIIPTDNVDSHYLSELFGGLSFID